MEFASSYAVGGPKLGHHADASTAADGVLPPPKPARMHWSTLLLVAGLAICALALLATIAGVPARVGYDVDGAPKRNKPDSNDPLKLAQSLDGNMKWISASSSDAPGAYVGYIKSIDRKEAAIPAMVQALVAMDASVRAIDAGLGEVGATTSAMGDDLEQMAATSSASAGTMSDLGDDIGFLSRSMLDLAASTRELTRRMAAIERSAGRIARNGTSAALANTRDLNASLPDGVPVPTTTDGRPLDQAMAGLATGGGTGAAVPGAPGRGAQPARPSAYEHGAMQ